MLNGFCVRPDRKEGAAMMMCDLVICIDPKHPDRNTINEIVAALDHMGATVVEVNENCHVIEAIVPAAMVPTLHHFGGVCYVRPVFSYFSPKSPANSSPAQPEVAEAA
jgi:hypothetical protein